MVSPRTVGGNHSNDPLVVFWDDSTRPKIEYDYRSNAQASFEVVLVGITPLGFEGYSHIKCKVATIIFFALFSPVTKTQRLLLRNMAMARCLLSSGPMQGGLGTTRFSLPVAQGEIEVWSNVMSKMPAIDAFEDPCSARKKNDNKVIIGTSVAAAVLVLILEGFIFRRKKHGARKMSAASVDEAVLQNTEAPQGVTTGTKAIV